MSFAFIGTIIVAVVGSSTESSFDFTKSSGSFKPLNRAIVDVAG